MRLTIGAHELLEKSNQAWMPKGLCAGVQGTVRAAEREQSAKDAERAKRIRIQHHITTMSTLVGMINAVTERGVQSVDVEVDPKAYTPTGHKDAARSLKWRESMRAERGALDKRGCWEIVRIPFASHIAIDDFGSLILVSGRLCCDTFGECHLLCYYFRSTLTSFQFRYFLDCEGYCASAPTLVRSIACIIFLLTRIMSSLDFQKYALFMCLLGFVSWVRVLAILYKL